MTECIKGILGNSCNHKFVDIYDEEDISIPNEVILLAGGCLEAKGSAMILEAGTLTKRVWVKTYCSKCGHQITKE